MRDVLILMRKVKEGKNEEKCIEKRFLYGNTKVFW